MRKATKVSQSSPKKSKITAAKVETLNTLLPLLDQDIPEHEIPDFEDDFIDGDLEPLEEEFINEFENVKFDESFLLDMSNEKKIDAIDNFKLPKTKMEHPMDVYLKKLIKDVLIQDFLPILKQQLKKE